MCEVELIDIALESLREAFRLNNLTQVKRLIAVAMETLEIARYRCD